MAALSVHYVTLRSRQIGLHLLPSLRGKKTLIVLGLVWSELCFLQKLARCFWNELRLNELDAQKVSKLFIHLFIQTWNKNRLGCTFVFHILLNPADNLARCTRLYCVSIDPSELYHIAQSCCLLHAFTPLWRLCTRLLSAIHWFPLVSWFSSFHALMLRVLSLLWYSEWFGLKHLYGTYASATFTSLKAKLPLIEFNVEIYNKIYFNIQQSFFS